MTIEVTAEDIERGRPKMASLCPIAIAIARAFKVVNATVCLGRYLVADRGFPLRSPEANSFIMAFDAGKPVAPFTFELPD